MSDAEGRWSHGGDRRARSREAPHVLQSHASQTGKLFSTERLDESRLSKTPTGEKPACRYNLKNYTLSMLFQAADHNSLNKSTPGRGTGGDRASEAAVR